jgi:ribonuclease R
VPKQTAPLITGKLSVHRDGYGFLIADRPVEGVDGDVFLPPDAASRAMHGDRIAVRLTRLGRGGRAEGDIVRILARAHPYVVGRARIGRRGVFVEPHDDRIQQRIYIPSNWALPGGGISVDRIGAPPLSIQSAQELDGMIVNVEIVEFARGGDDATGRITEVLGYPDDFGVDVEITIRKFHLPHAFPPDVLEAAARAPSGIPVSEISRRRDFRALEIVTIDGESARDFDDAVWADKLPNGNFALQVHIADVSHYVRPGSALDTEALLRGTSVYFPDRAVPMLPIELSTDICSLKPRVDRLVMSVLLELDHHGDVVRQEFCRGVIRSAERMTYTAVHALLEGEPEACARYAPLVPRFEKMRELALLLNRKRARRGSIDFDLPEAIIEFDEFGEMIGVSRGPRNIAHRIIEEFMLAANEAVASHLESQGLAMIYRIHEHPDPQKVFAFDEIAAQFGVSLGVGAKKSRRFSMTTRHRDGRKSRRDIELPPAGIRITPRHYQKLIARLEGRPEERILHYLMLRSLKQARYSSENAGHFALASDSYTHFTSPIRRYPDLLVHRILGAWLDGVEPPHSESQLAQFSDRCSETERTAAEAERELVEWKKLKFMADRVGDEFDALIISTIKFGFFVELDDIFVEGIVPVEHIPGDKFEFHENTRRIIGRHTRKEFRIGDRLGVRLDRVNSVTRRLEFSPVMPQTAIRKKGERN